MPFTLKQLRYFVATAETGIGHPGRPAGEYLAALGFALRLPSWRRASVSTSSCATMPRD